MMKENLAVVCRSKRHSASQQVWDGRRRCVVATQHLHGGNREKWRWEHPRKHKGLVAVTHFLQQGFMLSRLHDLSTEHYHLEPSVQTQETDEGILHFKVQQLLIRVCDS